MKLTFFGHSAFLIETEGTTILVDPFINENPQAHDVVRAEDLAPDVILVTHAHGDHWGDTPEIAKRTDALVISNFEIATYLTQKHGHQNVLGMNTGGSTTFDWGKVTVTDARHSSSFPDGSYGGNPVGFIIESEGKTIYAMGDTSPFSEMGWYADDFQIDVALMPIGDCFTMGPKASIRAATLTNAALYIPIHYDTFPPIEVDLPAWERLMLQAGHATRALAPGEIAEF